ncbi:hypothetical protein BH11BAC1_BH11BAC1_23520 [soil metagenome]
MLRNFFYAQVVLALFLFCQAANAGDRDTTAQFHHQKILIIPYEARMHISDADADISEYSEMTPPQVRSVLRVGITEKLNARLGAGYQTYSLLQDLRPEARQELERIYAAIDYSFDTSYAILHPMPDSSEKGRWNENKARKKELEKRTLSGDVKFMNAKVLDPHLLSSLNVKYGADLFIFLTQVEIKTHAKDCMDFQSHMYERDIKIHYSVFDKEGNQLFGDVASERFPSNSNEVGDIMAKNFPALSDKITAKIDGK